MSVEDAVTAVVKAAQKVDRTRRKQEEAQRIMFKTHGEKTKAENELREAIEKLAQANRGGKKKGSKR
jgi:hypothetical protein